MGQYFDNDDDDNVTCEMGAKRSIVFIVMYLSQFYKMSGPFENACVDWKRKSNWVRRSDDKKREYGRWSNSTSKICTIMYPHK